MNAPLGPGLLVPAILAGYLAVTGCTTPPVAHHYVISAVDNGTPVRQASAQDGPVVAITLAAMPDYLNQNGIVTRTSGNEVVRAEDHLWAGSLTDEITRVMGENLSLMVPTDRVVLGSSRRAIPADYTVDVEIVSFEREWNNVVQLVARWSLFRGDEKSLLVMRRSQIEQPVQGPDYDATVAAMSRALGDLTREIATAIDRSRGTRRSDRWAADRSSMSQSGAPSQRRRNEGQSTK